jgi:hypothetical protein
MSARIYQLARRRSVLSRVAFRLHGTYGLTILINMNLISNRRPAAVACAARKTQTLRGASIRKDGFEPLIDELLLAGARATPL